MIRITLMDGSQMEFPRSKTRAVLPLTTLFKSPCLHGNTSALFYHNGKIFPIYGPTPKSYINNKIEAEKRTWILLFEDHARVILGLPTFPEDAAKEQPNPSAEKSHVA